ncbi:hypothetical protein ABT013_33510 [Streptomyces bacillaris]|uniref:hypothetical protein n=1 Tax=Streptomyces bacillaris TaxID=68179 RepID=UPI0033646EF2
MSTDRQIAKVSSAAAVVRLGLEQLLAEAKDITNPAVRVEILRLLHPANTPQDGIIDPLRDLVAELAGQPSWEPLPVRMEQLRRGVQPKAQRTLMTPDAELAAEILDNIALVANRYADIHAQEPGSTAELEARLAVRRSVRAPGRRASSTPCSCTPLPTPPRSPPPGGNRCCSRRSTGACAMAGVPPAGRTARTADAVLPERCNLAFSDGY